MGSFSCAWVPAGEGGCVFQRRRVGEVSSGVAGVLPARDGDSGGKKKLNRTVPSPVAPPV